MQTEARRTYFVEQYVPGIDEASAALLSARLQAAVDQLRREGLDIEWLRSFALAEEDTYVCMVIAERAADVAFLHRTAGLSYEHVVEAIESERLSAP